MQMYIKEEVGTGLMDLGYPGHGGQMSERDWYELVDLDRWLKRIIEGAKEHATSFHVKDPEYFYWAVVMQFGGVMLFPELRDFFEAVLAAMEDEDDD